MLGCRYTITVFFCFMDFYFVLPCFIPTTHLLSLLPVMSVSSFKSNQVRFIYIALYTIHIVSAIQY